MRTRVTVTDSKRRARAFTLAEIMVATTVFAFLVGGIVFANLFGLSMFKITARTLDATDDTRKMVGKMANEIQTCKSAWIGNVSGGVFTQVVDGERQEGNGLLIYPSSNPTNFVIYFQNFADKTFRRTTGAPGSAIVLADSVTNAVVFKSQSYLGTVLTNNHNNRVIHVNLEFYQAKRFRQIADYFKLETSVTRRALE